MNAVPAAGDVNTSEQPGSPVSGASMSRPIGHVVTSEQPGAPSTGASASRPIGAGPDGGVSLVWATWALFAGLALMLTGAGLFGTLITVRAELDGFGPLAIGLVGAAYYGGFLAGSRLTLVALGTVGHIRVYAALASALSAAIVTAGMVAHPLSWIALRFVAGACLAGQFVVAESWLNQLVANSSRGRLLSLYTVTTVVAYGLGQLTFTSIDPMAMTGFGMAAALISVAVAPVALSEDAAPPQLATPQRMSLRELWSIVPTGVVTSLLVGVAHGAFLGLGAVYATRSGLSVASIGLFVAMPTLGSLVLSVPVSSASDGRDRRLVGAFAAIVAAGAATILLEVGPSGWAGLASMAVIGGMTYPLYSISGAYTNDWVPAAQLTAAASQLVLLFGAGAFVGPVVGSFVMDALGADGFVWTTIVTHGAIAVFLFTRVAQYPSAVRAKPWNAVQVAGRVLDLPATAVAMGRRIRPTNGRSRRARRARRVRRSWAGDVSAAGGSYRHTPITDASPRRDPRRSRARPDGQRERHR